MGKFKLIIILGATLVMSATALGWLALDEVEIHTFAPVPVYLTEGLPNARGNAIIGTLPQGTTIDAVPTVGKDHMVYRIKYPIHVWQKAGGACNVQWSL